MVKVRHQCSPFLERARVLEALAIRNLLHTETSTCPGLSLVAHDESPRLSRGQTKEGGKAFWDTEQPDCHLSCRIGTCIASQPLCPGKTSVGTLSTREQRERSGWSGGVRAIPRFHLDLDTLMPKELNTCAPMDPSTPIMPEERLTPHDEGMQQHADLARLCRGTSIPLTLFTERTRPTTVNAGTIHHAQAPISFSALLM